MKMENVVEKDFVTVHPEMDLGELVIAISASHRNVFPVTDKEGVLIWHCLVGRYPEHYVPPGVISSLHGGKTDDFGSGTSV